MSPRSESNPDDDASRQAIGAPKTGRPRRVFHVIGSILVLGIIVWDIHTSRILNARIREVERDLAANKITSPALAAYEERFREMRDGPTAAITRIIRADLPAILGQSEEVITRVLDVRAPARATLEDAPLSVKLPALFATGYYEGVLDEAKKQPGKRWISELLTMGAAARALYNNTSDRQYLESALLYSKQAAALTDSERDPVAWSDSQLAAALMLHDLGRHAEAEALLRSVVEVREKNASGPNDPRLAQALSHLAQALIAMNRHADAEPLSRRALAITEAAFAKDHPDVARRLNDLGALLHTTNRPREAETLVRRALAIDEARYGADHPGVLASVHNLAAVLLAASRHGEAESFVRRALAIEEASYGKHHLKVASRLTGLAQLRLATGHFAEAEPLMRRALEITELSRGGDHIDVATRLSDLAGLLQETGRPGEAEPLVRRALAIAEAHYGRDQPGVVPHLSNLARVLAATRRHTEAVGLLHKALAIDEAAYGRDHPNVAIRANNLAALLKDSDNPADAEPYMRRALAIDEATYGPDHPDVATDLNNLAQLLKKLHRPADAEPHLRRALEILARSSRTPNQQHPGLDAVKRNYAQLLLELGGKPEAVRDRIRHIMGR